MAITAKEQTSIVQLVVGMAGVAPRPSDLADLIAEFEAGSSLAQIAQNIVDHPAYSGDTGLFPNYLPNAIWAEQYLSMVLSELSATDLAIAIAAVTGDLNGGATRASVAIAVIETLSAETPPAGYEDAAAALANQTTVAEYYATNSTAVDANLTAMQDAIGSVDSSGASATAAIAVIAADVAADQPLNTLVVNLDAANTAKTALLTDLATTTGAIGTGIADADVAINSLVGGYDAATATEKVHLLAHKEDDNALALSGAVAAAAGTHALVDADTGLGAAIAVYNAAVATTTAATAAVATDGAIAADLAAALANFNTLNGTSATMDGDGTDNADAYIVIGASGLKLNVTEAANPGVTALLAASTVQEAADAALAAATTAEETALDELENLDTVSDRDADLILVAALMTFVAPATTGAPTLAEMAAEQASLDAIDATSASAIAFKDAVVLYHAEGGAAVALDTSPKTFNDQANDGLVVVAQGVIAALAAAVTNKADAIANVASLAVVTAAVAAAEDAFGDAGYAVPKSIASAIVVASLVDDLFLDSGISSQILNFGGGGDDLLFIGTDHTLNADTVAGANGDNAVLEVWITASGGNTVITLEESVFGSGAVAKEVYTLTLTGVASTDVSLVDGWITVV